jgi:hypothetical protein
MSAIPDLRQDPDALKVCKRPDPVRVAFASEDGVCQTLEGPVRYQAGDAIVTGVAGERWPIRREQFLTAYEARSPTRPGEDGLYSKRPSLTLARRLTRPIDVAVGWQDDPLHGEPGDWLLRYEDSSGSIIRDDIFRASYGPAEGETRMMLPLLSS